jgi:hypothetical protein
VKKGESDMKINIKPKVEPIDQYNIGLPQSLKRRMQTLKTEAPNRGADFNGTLVGIIEEYVTELEAQWGITDKSSRPNPRKSLGQPTPSVESVSYGNGTDKE